MRVDKESRGIISQRFSFENSAFAPDTMSCSEQNCGENSSSILRHLAEKRLSETPENDRLSQRPDDNNTRYGLCLW